jgi:hypothetical protein
MQGLIGRGHSVVASAATADKHGGQDSGQHSFKLIHGHSAGRHGKDDGRLLENDYTEMTCR